MDKAVNRVNKWRKETELPYTEKDVIKVYNELLSEVPYMHRTYSFLPLE
jgi:hypothetical protein